jgi:hypothetical protein
MLYIFCVKIPLLNYTGYPLNISGLRLANGVGFHDGRIEILVNGVWGTICGNTFSTNEADAICKMLEFRFVKFL